MTILDHLSKLFVDQEARHLESLFPRRLKRMITLRQEVEQGCRLPRGYGFAYRDFAANLTIAYPVPLNLFVRWARDVWWALAYYRPGVQDLALSAARIRGRLDEEERSAAEIRRLREQLDAGLTRYKTLQMALVKTTEERDVLTAALRDVAVTGRLPKPPLGPLRSPAP